MNYPALVRFITLQGYHCDTVPVLELWSNATSPHTRNLMCHISVQDVFLALGPEPTSVGSREDGRVMVITPSGAAGSVQGRLLEEV